MARPKGSKNVYPKRTPAEMQAIRDYLITTCEAYLAADQTLTIRQLFYVGLAADVWRKTLSDYQLVSNQMTELREQGVVSWDVVVDGGREFSGWTGWDSPGDYFSEVASGYRSKPWADQPTAVMVVLEKDTLKGPLRPVLERYRIPSIANRGMTSTTSVRDNAMWVESKVRDHDKDVVVLYIGDHDPSGAYASVEFEQRLVKYMDDPATADRVTLIRVAVNQADIATYNLPTRPTKTDDNPHLVISGFTGDSVEVEAIPPATLLTILETAVLDHLDQPVWKTSLEAERQVRKTVADAINEALLTLNEDENIEE